ncbi:MAG: phosphoribosylamine--glycine ligase [Deltaproteobacteria bacterium]|nr:phosphoribosylamine--glycine ligase [Deltaproteobacteria bacterium]
MLTWSAISLRVAVRFFSSYRRGSFPLSKRVLVIGSGGREHAIAWKLAQSPRVEKVYCTPGNAGMAMTKKVALVDIASHQIERLVQFAEQVDLTVVGPEVPLAEGLADRFLERGRAIVGVTQSAARLESSKIFAKGFMARHEVPTAPFEAFTDVKKALRYLQTQQECVIKADGLAGGKGVTVCGSREEGRAAVESLFAQGDFGVRGDGIVIEERLRGKELSYLALVDGDSIVPLQMARDYKRVGDGDTGPNTGGMGAFSPVPGVDRDLLSKVEERILKRVVRGLGKEGITYRGILYVGLMIVEGEPYVLEFNVRMGDPETQPIMMRLRSDLYDLFSALAAGKLSECAPDWDKDAALCVVMASAGYPGIYEKGLAISGLDTIEPSDQVSIFHAGTAWDAERKRFLTGGGRVLGVTARGETLEEARERAYGVAEKIRWPGCYYRKDIGVNQ